jgi:hypothetical protein
MEFSQEQQTQVDRLVKSGFPEQLAKVAIVSKSAGLESAIDDVAAFVKAAMSTEEGKSKIDTEVVKKRLQAGLAEVAGKSDFNSIQKSITIKNALARLNK